MIALKFLNEVVKPKIGALTHRGTDFYIMKELMVVELPDHEVINPKHNLVIVEGLTMNSFASWNNRRWRIVRCDRIHDDDWRHRTMTSFSRGGSAYMKYKLVLAPATNITPE